MNESDQTFLSRRSQQAGTQRSRQPMGRVPLRTADAKRSLQNITRWNSYLPANWVRTMVRMGWDYTT